MPDYKELLDYDILKIKRKIVKKYHKNEYQSTKYLNNDIKEKIKNDLQNELCLNEIQAQWLVDEKSNVNIRKYLLNLVGLGYKQDHYAIYSFTKGIRKLIMKYSILPSAILFGFISILFFILSFVNIAFIYVLISFLAIMVFCIILMLLIYKDIYIKEEDLNNDEIVESDLKIYKIRCRETPVFSWDDAIFGRAQRNLSDICYFIIYYKNEDGKKEKLIYILNGLYVEGLLINKLSRFVKQYNKVLKVKYYKNTRFITNVNRDLEKDFAIFIKK